MSTRLLELLLPIDTAQTTDISRFIIVDENVPLSIPLHLLLKYGKLSPQLDILYEVALVID